MPYKVFVAGEEALAADANSYLMSQTVPRFTNAAQRTAQLTAPVLNQLSMLDDRPGVLQRYTGSAWADMPGTLVRWAASNPNVIVASAQDFTVTSFTMPFTGSVALTGQAGFTVGGGATALAITMSVDPAAASTPAPSAAVAGATANQPANTYSGSCPYSALWSTVNSGTVVTCKLRVQSSAPGSMGSVLSHIQGQALIVPVLF
jgi:hypothetical protein